MNLDKYSLLNVYPLHTKGDDDAYESTEEDHPTPSPEIISSEDTESSHSSSSLTSSIDLDTFLGPEYPRPSGHLTTFKIVGDNIDKEVKPRHMRSDNQTRSLHYFHSYAVRDRLNLDSYDDNPSAPDQSSIDLELLLPSSDDARDIRHNMTILIARILKKYMPYFSKFAKGLERHITHDFYEEMAQRSVVVSRPFHVVMLCNFLPMSCPICHPHVL